MLEEYVVAYFFIPIHCISCTLLLFYSIVWIRVPISGYVVHTALQCTGISQHSRGVKEEGAKNHTHTRNEEEKIRKMRAKGILRACTYGHCCCYCCYFSILFRSRYRIGCSLYGATVIALECVDIDTMRDPSTCIDVVVVAFRSASFRNVRDVPSSTLQSRRKATTTHTHSKRR